MLTCSCKRPVLYQHAHNSHKRGLNVVARAKSPNGCEIDVTYTNDPLVVSQWISAASARDVTNDTPLIFGLDCEWRDPARLSTVQLATGSRCLVAHLSHMAYPRMATGAPNAVQAGTHPLPSALLGFLHDVNAYAVGAAVGDDVRLLSGLAMQHGEPPARVQSRDIATIAAAKGLRGRGLASICTELFAWPPTWKRSRVARSDWDRFPLTKSQLLYAALDAWASSEAYIALVGMPALDAAYVSAHIEAPVPHVH